MEVGRVNEKEEQKLEKTYRNKKSRKWKMRNSPIKEMKKKCRTGKDKTMRKRKRKKNCELENRR